MINDVLLFNQDEKCESLYIADGHCYLDTLFD